MRLMRQRVVEMVLAARRRRERQRAIAKIRITELAGSGMETFAADLAPDPKENDWPKWERQTL